MRRWRPNSFTAYLQQRRRERERAQLLRLAERAQAEDGASAATTAGSTQAAGGRGATADDKPPGADLSYEVPYRSDARPEEPRPLRTRPVAWDVLVGVWWFPLARGSRRPWLLLTLGLWALGALGVAALEQLEQAGPGEGMAHGAFGVLWAVAGVALGYAVLGYGCATILRTIDETSAGNQRLVGSFWNDSPDMFEALRQMLFLILVAAAFGVAASRLADSQGWPPAPVFAAVTFVVLPIILLSSIDGGSMFAIFSSLVARSLLRIVSTWLVFYIVAAVGIALTAATLGMLFARSPQWAVAVGAPLVATVVLWYGRLLGRLAWCIQADERWRATLAAGHEFEHAGDEARFP